MFITIFSSNDSEGKRRKKTLQTSPSLFSLKGKIVVCDSLLSKLSISTYSSIMKKIFQYQIKVPLLFLYKLQTALAQLICLELNFKERTNCEKAAN